MHEHYISGISRMNFVNVLIIVFFIKSIESFHETTLTKFETCSHKVILAGAPSPPPFPQEHLPLSANQVPCCLDPANERPAQGSRDRSEPRSRDPLDQWETRGAAAPGANGNCRLLVDDSSSTDGQLERGRGRCFFKYCDKVSPAPCNRCEKRNKMVGSVGSPMRSQSLARLHAVRELYVII